MSINKDGTKFLLSSLFYNARTKNLYEKCLPFWQAALISSEKLYRR